MIKAKTIIVEAETIIKAEIKLEDVFNAWSSDQTKWVIKHTCPPERWAVQDQESKLWTYYISLTFFYEV